ncbi:MAG: primosomal protein N' [Synechococcales cyanobacterium CRU_2_2]|nr:primosomal protein N' [Synechococcales cyanobacterium CRU_2_2]
MRWRCGSGNGSSVGRSVVVRDAQSARRVDVLVDCPGVQGLFTYQIPADLPVAAGDIVMVPFGSQQLGAIALRCYDCPPESTQSQSTQSQSTQSQSTQSQSTQSQSAEIAVETENLRPVIEVIAQGFFPQGYWSLLEQVADYYATPLIQVIRTALPPKLLGKSRRRVRLSARAIASAQAEMPTVSAIAQAVLARLLQSKQGSYTWRYLKQQIPAAEKGLRELLRLGWIESFLEAPTSCQPKLQRVVTLLPEPLASEPAFERSLSGKLSSKQQEVLALLRRQGGELPMAQLLALGQTSDSTVRALAQKNWVAIETREVLRLEGTAVTGGDRLRPVARDRPKVLTPEQTRVVAEIQAIAGFQSVLLHGVTGSGKTEVYLQAIAPMLDRGASALVLVPEIGLTPQLTDRFRLRFGDRVCVYHSGLSTGERYDTWRQMLLGRPQVVIGTRSAVFAPLPQLGLIILDEEHDSSFKQDQPMPCYHARTVARWRAQAQNCPLILGSATPAAETWHAHAPSQIPGSSSERSERSGQPGSTARYLSLPQRIHARPHPPVEIIDLREELLQGNRSVFSRTLQQAIQDTLDKRQQGLLFIHRRGHSTFVSCRSCGEAIACPHCDVSLTYHHTHDQARPVLRCHYCNYVQAHPKLCPSCQSPQLKNFGSGTQRIAQELQQVFPQLRSLRYDSDTTRTKGSHRRLLDRFAAGDADFLVGTQMLSKGIDLPQVTLVGIVAADGLLHQADFRAAERACQTLLQVAGRAGRGDEPGRVILQTYLPEHPVVTAVQQQSYGAFLETELRQRQELAYPPQGKLILLRLSGPYEGEVMATADRLAQALEVFAQEITGREITGQGVMVEAAIAPEAYQVLGPAPAAIARVADRYRWQLLLKLAPTSHLPTPHLPNTEQSLLTKLMQLRQSCPANVSLMIDVDPLYLN